VILWLPHHGAPSCLFDWEIFTSDETRAYLAVSPWRYMPDGWNDGSESFSALIGDHGLCSTAQEHAFYVNYVHSWMCCTTNFGEPAGSHGCRPFLGTRKLSLLRKYQYRLDPSSALQDDGHTCVGKRRQVNAERTGNYVRIAVQHALDPQSPEIYAHEFFASIENTIPTLQA